MVWTVLCPYKSTYLLVLDVFGMKCDVESKTAKLVLDGFHFLLAQNLWLEQTRNGDGKPVVMDNIERMKPWRCFVFHYGTDADSLHVNKSTLILFLTYHNGRFMENQCPILEINSHSMWRGVSHITTIRYSDTLRELLMKSFFFWTSKRVKIRKFFSLGTIVSSEVWRKGWFMVL